METEKTEQNSIKEPARVNAAGIPVEEDGKFTKGVSGNPNGRPKGTVSIVEAMRRKLKEKVEGDKRTYLEFIVDKIFVKALVDGSERVLLDIVDRIDGKALQEIKHHEVSDDEITPLVEQLKTKDEGRRQKIIEYLDAIDKEWEAENKVRDESADDDRATDIQRDTESTELKDGETPPRVE